MRHKCPWALGYGAAALRALGTWGDANGFRLGGAAQLTPSLLPFLRAGVSTAPSGQAHVRPGGRQDEPEAGHAGLGRRGLGQHHLL